MKVFVVASTRPEVIKLAPILNELRKKNVEHLFATTGQHYDDRLFKNFLKDLKLGDPDYNLEVGSGSHGYQTGAALMSLEEILLKESPDVLLVEGDTNSVLAGALAAVKHKIPVGHVEAGLRSFDRTMPEEINRILADHSSELLFAPTEHSALNLVNEGIPANKIHIVGNTIVDATLDNIETAKNRPPLSKDLPDDYLLLTLHRQENTDDKNRLEEIFLALLELGRDVVFPIHPRTSNLIRGTKLEKLLENDSIHITSPLGYLDFLRLLYNSFAVLTDSGGLQEEAITLNVPCLTLRYNTERPETVWAGGNIVVGTGNQDIITAVKSLEDVSVYNAMKNTSNPYGDGKTAERIVEILLEKSNNDELTIESSDTRKGFRSRKIVEVDESLAGTRVVDSGFKIQKIFAGGEEFFPYPKRVLEKGQTVEIIESD